MLISTCQKIGASEVVTHTITANPYVVTDSVQSENTSTIQTRVMYLKKKEEKSSSLSINPDISENLDTNLDT